MNRQRRHSSNDTQNQRNQHRQNPQHQKPQAKKIITPEDSTNSQQPSKATSEDLPKLNPSDPAHARRIKQRRRQVLFGKNTSGYEEYIKKIPKHKRRPRSLDCPMTPDHTLDVPTKRWQGLMNAWRRGLHKFDPPDLHLRQPAQNTITLAPRPCVTKDDKAQEEIAQAKASGLQVAFDSMNVGKEAGLFSFNVAGDDDGATAGGDKLEETTIGKSEEKPFDEEAAYRQGGVEGGDPNGGFLEESDSDSDDDLL